MADIGFELRKLLRQQSYFERLRSYGDARIHSCGPWVLSILALMALGFLSMAMWLDTAYPVTRFAVSVTYLVAASLVLSGLAQPLCTRFVAGRLFKRAPMTILPNLVGLLSVVTITAGALGLAILLLAFGGTPLLYRIEMLVGFVLLCNIWCLTAFVAAMKAYRQLLWAYIVGYGAALALGLLLRGFGLEGLLGGFVAGHGLLLCALVFRMLRDYPGERPFTPDFAGPAKGSRSLMIAGLLYNLGIWADKLLFWYNPDTSVAVTGPLRASPLYDLPIFLAYLSIVPGMAVFLMRMETDFTRRYDAYHDAVRDGATLAHIERMLDHMVVAVRRVVYDIFKIQGITVVALLLAGPALFAWLGFSPYYVPLFNIGMVAAGAQLLFTAILSVLFCLDKLKLALLLCLLFCVANVLLTALSQYLGAAFHGYGLAVSLMVSSLTGLALLDRVFQQLTYETFMLQRPV